MDAKASQKLRDRLRTAQRSVQSLVAVRDHPTKFKEQDFRRDWYEFLLAANGIFTVLEQATKDRQSSRNWMRDRKRERRNDPLLRYLHHARNAEEHRVDPVTGIQLGRLTFESDEGVVGSLENFDGKRGTFKPGPLAVSGSQDMSRVNHLKVYPAQPKVVTVVDRDGSFPPPTEHLGIKIANVDPASIAFLALKYFRRVVAEAEAM